MNVKVLGFPEFKSGVSSEHLQDVHKACGPTPLTSTIAFTRPTIVSRGIRHSPTWSERSTTPLFPTSWLRLAQGAAAKVSGSSLFHRRKRAFLIRIIVPASPPIVG